MPETECSLESVLTQLDEAAPGAPLLALGQTVLWDEPMKGGVALALKRRGSDRRFVAGVHDTDYFAKLPYGPRGNGRFAAIPHNDTTTRGLWSAAGEFSALFGSETVVSRHDYQMAGLRMAAVTRSRPGILDEATEAWRWRGIVSLDDDPPLAAQVPLDQVFPVLQETLEWALEETAESLAESERRRARESIDRLQETVCRHVDEVGSLTELYRAMLPEVYEFAAGEPVPLEATATSDLLRFTPETAGLPRFAMADLFIRSDSRGMAKTAYDEVIRGSEIYELSRFGTGAIPFDLVIPGHGRGTIRLGNRGAVIMTREPQFLSFKRPIANITELAEAVVRKFGDRCVLIGKAVTLIGMLAREFVFVFHEGASSYVKHTRRFHELLRESGRTETYHPILRIRYHAWDALGACCSWLKLPEPLRGPFGTEDLCGPSFAGRWREVGREQEARLARLGELRSPPELIRYLESEVGGAWESIAREYEDLHHRLEGLAETIGELKKERHACYRQLRALREARVVAERAKGEHFRERIFEKVPTEADLEERKRLAHEVDLAVRGIEEAKFSIAELRKQQAARASDPQVLEWHERRRAIELEAELKRMRLIREAVVASRGLERAGRRPSAWWFPIVCPGGKWFHETIDRAEAYLEPL